MQGSHIMHKLIVTSLTLILILGANTAWAVGEPAAMTRTEFDQLMQDISNWGRWGKEDELGTLNLITPEVRKSAAALVTDGVTVSMSLALNKVADPLNANPFHHKLTRSEFAGHQVAGDEYRVDYHGFAHSHMDGLPHFAHKGFFYNGFPFDGAKPGGADKLGIHNAGINGVFTRGVLVDLPRHLGVSFLEPGAAISAADLQAWEEATGVTIGSGDVLLIRTGRWAKVAKDGQWDFLSKAAGMQASVAAWLKQRDVAVIGCDGISDVMPSGVEGLANPLHELVIVGLGMPILDNLDLEAVAAEAATRGRHTFLFVGAPLRVPGGTGSPMNPLAVF